MSVPNIKEAVERSADIKDVEKIYEPLIKAYLSIILEERPDLVLLNGTYYLPWCLYLAAKRAGVRTVIHYHGCLTKETQHFAEHERTIFHEMENVFFQMTTNIFFRRRWPKIRLPVKYSKRTQIFCVLPTRSLCISLRR